MSNGSNDTSMDMTESQAGAPLLSDFGAAEEMSTNSGRSNKTRRVGVAALIIVGAAGGIFVMRQVGLGAASVIASIVVDYDPNEFTKGPGDPAVLDELVRSRVAIQVPAEVIDQDPFVLEGASAAVDPVKQPAVPQLSAEERARQLLAQKIKDATGQVAVQSVMGGPIPLARINGTIYRLGDTLLDVLKIEAIEGREVTIRGGDKLYGFSMGEPGVQWTRDAK